MTATDEFDKLTNKLHQLEEAQADRELETERLKDARSAIRARLKEIHQQRIDLNEQESQLKNDLTSQGKELETLDRRKHTQDTEYNALMKQLSASKRDRNKKLIGWWMSQYGNFDDMNLSELKDWLSGAVISQREMNDTEFATNSEGDEQYKEHIKKMAKVSETTSEDQAKASADENDESKDSDKEDSKNKTQTLAEKQRIQGNRQKNAPVKTKADAEDDEQKASPFGTEDINEEIAQYADKHSKDDAAHHVTKEEVADKFKNEFNL